MSIENAHVSKTKDIFPCIFKHFKPHQKYYCIVVIFLSLWKCNETCLSCLIYYIIWKGSPFVCGKFTNTVCRKHLSWHLLESKPKCFTNKFIRKYFFWFLFSRILNKFYNEGGKMPGVPQKRRLPRSRTFPSFVFWMAALLPFLATKWGRSAYWKMWLVSSFGTVSYMMLLFGKVQQWRNVDGRCTGVMIPNFRCEWLLIWIPVNATYFTCNMFKPKPGFNRL